MSFNFRSQLKIGQFGESIFLQANPEIKPHTDYQGDFVDVSGRKVELKTDMYSMEATPNYFFEFYSDKAKKSPGGPWQSISHGTEIFVYMFLPSLTYFTFNTQELVGRLETLIPNLAPYDVRNTSHVSMGYRVPRSMLADICTQTILEVRKRES